MLLSSMLPIAAVGAGVGGAGLWWNKRRNQGPTIEERFEGWLMTVDGISSDVKKWTSELSEEEQKRLVARLGLHCAELGMELEWLFGEELNHQDLRDALEETVMAYVSSFMSGVQAEEDARAFKTYRAFDKKPKSKPNQELGRKLYAKLVDDGVIAVSTENLLETSHKKRQKYIVTTIRQSATDSVVGFYQALKAVLREMDPANENVSSQVEATPEPATDQQPEASPEPATEPEAEAAA